MTDRAHRIVDRLLVENDSDDFDLVDALFQLPNAQMEYWALYVDLDYAEQKNYWFHVAFRRPTDWPVYPVGITIDEDTPHAKQVIAVALSKGFNAEHVKDIRSVCKTDKVGYQAATDNLL